MVNSEGLVEGVLCCVTSERMLVAADDKLEHIVGISGRELNSIEEAQSGF